MITTVVGFCLFFGAPLAWNRLKVDGFVSFLLFVWGVHILVSN